MPFENEWGTWPSYTCPVCGTVDEEEQLPGDDGAIVCHACGAIGGEAVQG